MLSLALVLMLVLSMSVMASAETTTGYASWTESEDTKHLTVTLDGDITKTVQFINGKKAPHTQGSATALHFLGSYYVEISASFRPAVVDESAGSTALQKAGATGTLVADTPFVGIMNLSASLATGIYYPAAIVSGRTGTYEVFSTATGFTATGTITYAPVSISGVTYIYSAS